MREIKFRAWDKNHNKMLYMGDNEWSLTYGKMLDAFEDEELMQYTGLKDKNGKEIYEGDIILLKRYNTASNSIDDISTELKLEVVFKNGCFNCVYEYSGGSSILFGILREGGYKIGNIYENPDLIDNK